MQDDDQRQLSLLESESDFDDEEEVLDDAPDRAEQPDSSDALVLPEVELASAPRIEDVALEPRRSRFAGAILGAAIGDAIGHPTEFLSTEEIRRRWGPTGVSGYELFWESDGRRYAPYTDDTQMAEIVLRSLISSAKSGAELDETMHTIAQGFVEWSRRPQGGHRAPGNACLSGCRALASGRKWWEAGGATAGGCGSVMRAYPFGLVFANDPARAERWSVQHSKLTHRDPIALAACAAMAVGMALTFSGESIDIVLSEMVAAACRQSPRTAVMMAQALDDARSRLPGRRAAQAAGRRAGDA
jgi:ADP-ribosylglycohydrolase